MNVIGASVSEATLASHHETRDIVLPNQTDHVPQVAVDVSVMNNNNNNRNQGSRFFLVSL